LFSVYEGSAAPVAIGFTGRGIWDSGSTYAVNDIATVTGSGTYLALQPSTNQDPTTATAFWMFLEGISASALPVQTSQAGKFLTTDGSNASWAEVDVAGGATITDPMSSNVTLTAASKRVQVFNPTAGGLTVTLPAAGGLNEGDSFLIQNKSSSFGITVLDSSANILAFLPSGKKLKLFLANAATSDWEGTITDSVPGVAINFIFPLTSTTANVQHGSKIVKLGTNNYRLVFSRNVNRLDFFDFTLNAAGAFTINNSGTTTGTSNLWNEDQNDPIIELASGIYATSGYGAPSAYPALGKIFSISGNTITINYDTSVLSGKTDIYSSVCVPCDGRKFVVIGAAYWTQADTGPRARVIDATSSLTSPTLGSETLFNFGSVRGPYVATGCGLTTNKGLILSGAKPTDDGVANITPKIAVWTVSGTTISIGTVYDVDGSNFLGDNDNGKVRVVSLSATEAVVVWYAPDGIMYGKHMTISGSNITFGAKTVLSPIATSNFTVSKLTDSSLVILQTNSLDLSKWYMTGVNVSGTTLSVPYVARVSEYAGTSRAGFQSLLDSDKGTLLQTINTPTSIFITQAVTSSI
jgi:hypothetical protein